MSSSSSSDFDIRPIKVIIKKKKKIVIKDEIGTEKESKYCNVEGCKEKKHGKFDECKDHFMGRHRKETKFKWSPPEVGYKTIIDILKCYPHVYSTDQVKVKHINNSSGSKIPITCLKCNYLWEVPITNLINAGNGCINCADRVRWNLDKFKKKMSERKEIDISKVNEKDIKSYLSHVPLSCKVCYYEWNPTISGVVTGGYGCPSCSGQAPISLKMFQKRMSYHKNIDITNVEEKHIAGIKSYVPVSCKICFHKWSPSITSLINNMSGCPKCAGILPWTLELFIERMSGKKEINISKVEEKHIKGKDEYVPVSCYKCQHEWFPSIASLVNRKSGCPKCAGTLPWTLERFIREMENKEDFDITKVKEKHINGYESHLPIKCKKCNWNWEPSIDSLINGKHGCPRCRNSKGIKCLEEYLKNLNIIYKLEKTFKDLLDNGKLRIDIYISEIEGINYPICIEFDGNFPGSHFSYQTDIEKARHISTVKRDKIKDNYAMNNKMHMIRIPYTCFPKNSEKKLKETLEEALEILKTKKKPYLCLMDEELYRRRDENLLEE